ncbi:biopolymer transporter ExbD [Bacterioplanes sanyensis]|uniref:ExbD/TolR family protein n=1 Tax=Bacterioplanes sanyensis TaxID=1249553 RepID=UPI001674C2C9|nr:biopolymer transporter ExbD [Bacterioplanes sanyensis]GGY54137.1 biopolymer transporter ExbD [Bacterioplanes sanyensis]
MNFKRQNREPVEVNLTPLIDIVFLLLIFFMVSTTFTKENHLKLDLPEASAEPVNQPDSVVEIIINAQGDYSINGQALLNKQLETLKRGLQKSLAGRDDAPVVITADANTPHQAVVRAMDAAGQVGLVNLSITTRQPRSSE